MPKQDILSYLNSLRKPTSIDPQQKWIAHTTTVYGTMLNFLGGYTTKKNLTIEKELVSNERLSDGSNSKGLA
jgi:hypothetical protein